jgi:hypothetical protein
VSAAPGAAPRWAPSAPIPTPAQLHHLAATVECPTCAAPVDAPCVNAITGQPVKVPHTPRVDAATHRAALALACPACQSPPGTGCRTPDGANLPALHDDRRKAARVWIPPLTERELADIPRRLSDGERWRRGQAELENRRRQLSRAQMAQRAAELRGNARAGDLTEVERAELLDLDAILAPADDDPNGPADPAGEQPAVEQPDDDNGDTAGSVTWIRGPHDPRRRGHNTTGGHRWSSE